MEKSVTITVSKGEIEQQKHSVGPWSIWVNGNGEMGVDDLFECSVCTVEKGKTQIADALLIAAAPDMLKVLNSCLRDCEMALSGEWDRSDDGFEATAEMIRKVIDKAMGE